MPKTSTVKTFEVIEDRNERLRFGVYIVSKKKNAPDIYDTFLLARFRFRLGALMYLNSGVQTKYSLKD